MTPRGGPANLARTTLTVLLVVLNTIATAGWIPSPDLLARWHSSDRPDTAGERYPCEACGCGCESPDECWNRCCCHDEHERLVWALRHGVYPPNADRFNDAQWLTAANAVRPGSAHCPLCASLVKASLRRGLPWAGVDSAPASPSADCCKSDNGRGAIPGMSAAACKGLHAAAAPATPLAARALGTLVLLPSLPNGVVADMPVLIPPTETLEPPPPPPRPDPRQLVL